MKIIKKLVFVSILMMFFASCGEDSSISSNKLNDPQPTDEDVSLGINISSITGEEYEELSVMDKYRVANKVLNTLYKGIGYKEFVDANTGELKVREDYIEEIKEALDTPLDDLEDIEDEVDDKYEFIYPDLQRPLAEMYEMPLSKDYFDRWMAYQLMNTILFSPAVELETVSFSDITKIYKRLVKMISKDKTINEIVYSHVISQENWRRFRSPEDNVREMMEIYLDRFVDEEVPRAAKACQNWHLGSEDQGYVLIRDTNVNTEPQYVLDTTVKTCTDFYKALALHESLIPKVVKIIVNHLFSTYPEDKKQDIVAIVLSKNPKTFREIYKTLIFSKEYIFRLERPKTIEEAFFGTAGKLNWEASSKYFDRANRPIWRGSTQATYAQMKQAVFTYKLGRSPKVPLDTLSFMYYHRAIRDDLLTDIKKSSSLKDGGIPKGEFTIIGNEENTVRYLIRSILEREPTQEEITKLIDIIKESGYTKGKIAHKIGRASIVLDYISRLSEFYFFKKIDTQMINQNNNTDSI